MQDKNFIGKRVTASRKKNATPQEFFVERTGNPSLIGELRGIAKNMSAKELKVLIEIAKRMSAGK